MAGPQGFPHCRKVRSGTESIGNTAKARPMLPGFIFDPGLLENESCFSL